MMGEVFLLLTVGLCGGSGTGKTEAQAAFSLYGIPGLDTDAVYHTLIATDTPLSRQLSARFGTEILAPNGGIDRAALSALVFGDDAESAHRREALNAIAHRAVLAECRVWLAEQRKNGAFAAIINAPLLFESGFHTECDLTVSVLAPLADRVDRITKRDGISPIQAEHRIRAQLDDSFLIEHTDYRIENNGTRAELFDKVKHLASIIKSISEGKSDGKS